jgi:hypothetical protein
MHLASTTVIRPCRAAFAAWCVFLANMSCTDGALRIWDDGNLASSSSTDETLFSTSGSTSSNGEAYTSTNASQDRSSGPESVSPPIPLPVDDFEDGDTRAASSLGWWYTQGDTTGEQNFRIEASGDEEGGAFSAHYSGFGFQVWGALLGLDFTPDEGQLDASAYTAMHFRARAGEASVTQVSARLLDPSGQFALDLELTTEWRDYELPFAALHAVDGGPQTLAASKLTQFHLFVFSAEYFDLWLDDFELR